MGPLPFTSIAVEALECKWLHCFVVELGLEFDSLILQLALLPHFHTIECTLMSRLTKYKSLACEFSTLIWFGKYVHVLKDRQWIGAGIALINDNLSLGSSHLQFRLRSIRGVVGKCRHKRQIESNILCPVILRGTVVRHTFKRSSF